ncbi:prephenate dehydratase [Neomegalonema sp.]|uniref:prephenate dehydratase n=1 Tax=Neomegalonema sp. TaxID=2039713 RepID=UPI00261482AC|nr:prephenate dehydratase [Neomegalonema sp.]MDD2868001.1 prephenate dehydratase [Neomegalonema sp.]
MTSSDSASTPALRPAAPSNPDQTISFQGDLGAYSHQACDEVFPEMTPLPCTTFEEAVNAVKEGRARFAMLPVENSIYGRVADVHQILPDAGLYIIGEHFVRIALDLLALPGVKLDEVREAQSHIVALGQCKAFLRRHGIQSVTGYDTAGSAAAVAREGKRERAAIASALAGKLYGLESVASGIEDADHNTTRFLVVSRRKLEAEPGTRSITSFVFRVKNLPASLYKSLGGFATNGVNLVRLESRMVGGAFEATEFWAEAQGHVEDENMKRALEEIRFFTTHLKVLGVYPASDKRP